MSSIIEFDENEYCRRIPKALRMNLHIFYTHDNGSPFGRMSQYTSSDAKNVVSGKTNS